MQGGQNLPPGLHAPSSSPLPSDVLVNLQQPILMGRRNSSPDMKCADSPGVCVSTVADFQLPTGHQRTQEIPEN